MRTTLLRLTLLCSALVVTVVVLPARGSDWPRYRGPNGTGIAEDKDVPVEFSDTRNVIWKVKVPGLGNGSPIVWGDRLFIQSSSDDGKNRLLLCFDVLTGKERWNRSLASSPTSKRHPKNTLASSTPATDGKQVYAVFWDGNDILLAAYDIEGKPCWSRDLGPYDSQHGVGHSPIVYDGKVFVVNDQDGLAAVYAFDAATGALAWRSQRQAFRACYSTPCILERPGEAPRLIVASTAGITAYSVKPPTKKTGELAGEEIWTWTWAFDGNPLRTVASPVAGKDVVVANGGEGGGASHLAAVRVGGQGDVTKTNLAWEKKKGMPYVPSLLVSGDHLYYVWDKGLVGCLELATGKEVWQSARLKSGSFSASPVLIDGKIYACAEDGRVYVVATGSQYKLLATNALNESIIATPAVANNRLYIRGKDHLFCIGKSTAVSAAP